MASKYLDMCPPVLASLKAGTPIIAIETGFFMQLPYPRNLQALQECEQAFYRRDCVPCCVGIVNGRLKAGLSKQDMDTLCRSGGSCARRSPRSSAAGPHPAQAPPPRWPLRAWRALSRSWRRGCAIRSPIWTRSPALRGLYSAARYRRTRRCCSPRAACRCCGCLRRSWRTPISCSAILR